MFQEKDQPCLLNRFNRMQILTPGMFIEQIQIELQRPFPRSSFCSQQLSFTLPHFLSLPLLNQGLFQEVTVFVDLRKTASGLR